MEAENSKPAHTSLKWAIIFFIAGSIKIVLVLKLAGIYLGIFILASCITHLILKLLDALLIWGISRFEKLPSSKTLKGQE